MIANVLLLTVPTATLVYFCFFAAYNYVYTVSSLFPPKLKKVDPPPGGRVAIVIVSFNERNVIADTVAACEKISYQDKTIIVGDDSNDPETIALLRGLATERGCKLIDEEDRGAQPGVELYESDAFVLFHRLANTGFKAGNLKVMQAYLTARGFDYMYLLDADWRPQTDVVERCLELIEAEPEIAFVQTKRLSYHGKWDHFQRCLAINEEACYFVDLPGRQRRGDMILFTGCCAMFKLSHLRAVGGFAAGHLTEDIDLSNRLYLAGYRGVYAEHIQNVGEVPPNYRAYRRQQERWAIGSARTCRDYFRRIIDSPRLNFRTKGSLIRQNGYYTTPLAAEVSTAWAPIAILLAMWGAGSASTTAARPLWLYTQAVMPILGLAALSAVAPLIVAAVKKRSWLNLLYIPAACWLALSITHTYAIANIKGFRNTEQSWYLTPKTNRQRRAVAVRGAWRIRALNLATLVVLVGTFAATSGVTESGVALGLAGLYAVLWVPSMVIGSIAS